MSFMDFLQKKQQLSQLLRIDDKRKKISEIKQQMNDADFWRDYQTAGELSKTLSALQNEVEIFDSINSEQDIFKLERETLYSGKYDESGAIMAIYAGAGGTEAQDWSGMLKRMYERYCQRYGYTFVVLDEAKGEEAGVKSMTAEIKGFRAFGNLKSEAGVHRLVRISPFDADRARHTSFALVDIIPELTREAKIDIDPKDLKVDFYRSGGHGGQNVNKVETAVRITHLPTGIVVTSQNERSQAQNREIAMLVLKSKLHSLMEKEHKQKIEELRGVRLSPEWGSQIRSYILHPYQMVKDHRTNYETSETQKVLDGELDGFIESYLKSDYNR